MAQIYQHSYLTLAATGSSDSTGGCYSSTNAYMAKVVTANFQEDRVSSINYRRALPHWWNPSEDNNKDFLRAFDDELPLLNRAWCFQERMLSPRVLHFGPAELLWECMQTYSCECTRGIRVYEGHNKRKHIESLEKASEEELSTRWREIVSEYSQLDITYPSDRLPALLGVATQMLALSPSRIICGSWESSLLHDLLWQASRQSRAPKCRPSGLVYPTWSWLSSLEKVHYPFDPTAEIELRARIEKVEPKRGEDEKDGVVFWASLAISAPVISVTLSIKETEFWEPWTPCAIHRIGQPPWSYVLEIEPDYNYDSEGPGHLQHGTALCCVHIATESAPMIGDLWEIGLVLICRDEEKGVYERVGLVRNRLGEFLAALKASGEWKTITLV